MNLQLWNRNSTDKARNLIRTLLAANSTPLSTQQIYKLVVKTESPESAHEHGEHHHGILPPHPKNVIRSMSYLKHVVLPDLERRRELEKVHSVRTLTPEEVAQRLQTLTKSARKAADLPTTTDVWLWQTKVSKPKPEPEPEAEVFGVAVGVGADWSHLNKRRRRAREGKVARDVKWLRQLDKMRQEAVASTSSSP